jgi:hypothetical protein
VNRKRKSLSVIVRRYGVAMLAVALWYLAAVSTGCVPAGPQQAQGGTGSEIVGKAEYPESTALQKRFVSAVLPVVLGRVFVYTNAFIPDTSWATTGALPRAYSDSTGAFQVYDVPRGPVVVEVNDGSGKGAKDTITVDRDSTRYNIGTLDLGPTGAAKIQAQTSLTGRVRFYVSIRGTRLTVRGNQAGIDVVLGDIPAGSDYTVSIRVYEPVYLALDIPNVTISPGATTALQTFTIQ